MGNPTAAKLVIGDEIMSGRTRAANMHLLAGALTEHGIDLREVRVVSDDAEAIVAATRALSGAYDHLFTSGGIGPAHDDLAADCIARAIGAPIDVRAAARMAWEMDFSNSSGSSPFIQIGVYGANIVVRGTDDGAVAAALAALAAQFPGDTV